MTARITSLQNPRVKSALKLRSRRGRDQQGRIVIDGAAEIRRALAAGVDLVELFVCDAQLTPTARSVCQQAVELRVPLVSINSAVLGKVAFGQRCEGLVAVARTPDRALEQLELPPDSLIVVLERIEKPGNVGAIVRSADAAGLAAVIVVDGGTDLYNPNTIRSSLGTVFTMPFVSAAAKHTRAWLGKAGFRLLAARVDAPRAYTDVDYRGAVALVLGSESAGLSSQWTDSELTAVSLPMRGSADSLNVSATAAILFYEALRQRGLADE